MGVCRHFEPAFWREIFRSGERSLDCASKKPLATLEMTEPRPLVFPNLHYAHPSV